MAAHPPSCSIERIQTRWTLTPAGQPLKRGLRGFGVANAVAGGIAVEQADDHSLGHCCGDGRGGDDPAQGMADRSKGRVSETAGRFRGPEREEGLISSAARCCAQARCCRSDDIDNWKACGNSQTEPPGGRATATSDRRQGDRGGDGDGDAIHCQLSAWFRSATSRC
jgi:hypothetical protein